MTVKWPNERESANQLNMKVTTSSNEDTDFRQLLDACNKEPTSTLDDAANWIVDRGGEIADLEQKINLVCEQLSSRNVPYDINLLMAIACAIALAKSPTLKTWEHVRNLKSNSYQLDHSLSNAMIVFVEKNGNAGTTYKKLAKQVFSALDNFTLESQFNNVNNERKGIFEHWTESQNKLDEVWWGLRGWSGFMTYEEEIPLLEVLYQLEPDDFANVLAQSDNPYLVSSTLIVSGIGAFSPKFSEWEKLTSNAPHAFEVDGKWNGSVLLPLLLVEARNQLSQSSKAPANVDLSNTEIEATKNEIINVAEAVVTILAKRNDALPLFIRWSAWLMRQLLKHSEKELNDVRSSAFIDSTLIEAIGRQLKDKSIVQVTSPDASMWESWCYYCVLAFHAYNNFIAPPDSSVFLTEWSISPDQWIETKGKNLREQVSLITPISKEMPGLTAQLLAYPIAQSNNPTEQWINLWNATYAIREIVEFGDLDASGDEYQSRSEAGKIMLLIFRIGLAILDQRVSRCLSSNSHEARSQAKLHKVLASAVLEMRDIDNTLNQEEWLAAFRHLAVRRLIWEVKDSDQAGQNFVFQPKDKPMFSDYILAVKGDPIELISVLQSVLLNNHDIKKIQYAINTAKVNLRKTLDVIERLNRYHPRKYAMGESQLKNLEGLLEGGYKQS